MHTDGQKQSTTYTINVLTLLRGHIRLLCFFFFSCKFFAHPSDHPKFGRQISCPVARTRNWWYMCFSLFTEDIQNSTCLIARIQQQTVYLLTASNAFNRTGEKHVHICILFFFLMVMLPVLNLLVYYSSAPPSSLIFCLHINTQTFIKRIKSLWSFLIQM